MSHSGTNNSGCAWAWVLGGFGSGRCCGEAPSFGQSGACEVVGVCQGGG